MSNLNNNSSNVNSINDCVFGDKQSEQILHLILSGNLTFPDKSIGKTGIILYGVPGTGKTTLAMQLCDWLEDSKVGSIPKMPPRVEYMRSSTSDKTLQSIDVNTQTISINKSSLHYFVLDEADNMTTTAMNNLKSLMSSRYSSVFVMTTNHLSSIPKPIQDRSYYINMNAAPAADYESRLKDIALKQYGCKLSDASVKQCAAVGEGSWRQKLTALNIACVTQQKSNTTSLPISVRK